LTRAPISCAFRATPTLRQHSQWGSANNMKDRFKAVLITKEEGGQKVESKELGLSDLMDGDVVVEVSHSTVNFKDGLALTGRSPVVRKFPMIPGIDLAGTVAQSSNPEFKRGDKVVLNGYGLSETHFGGYSEVARVKGEWLVPLPKEFTPAEAMAIGTAGYTAMLCLLALEDAGITPGKGPVVVTGAAGGVGSVAIAVLAKLGYRVIASTGRVDEEAYLKSLGAAEIIPRTELSGEPKMLAKERWAGAVDSVGSKTLANVIASTQYGGAVAACGLAQGMDLPTSVAPFILRGISLLGIDSVQMRRERRLQAWQRLARDLDVKKLTSMTRTIKLAGVMQAAEDILAGKVRGRIVVEIA
jgi:acrylyl-CoA reductase (NADPH)